MRAASITVSTLKVKKLETEAQGIEGWCSPAPFGEDCRSHPVKIYNAEVFVGHQRFIMRQCPANKAVILDVAIFLQEILFTTVQEC
ncbi:hypothetical protein EJB05_29966, partial [Eragrostis curvula]